jgi:hypothetical protein
MDPISIGLGIVGLGTQIFGGLAGASVSKQQSAVSQDIATQEQAINAQKMQQTQLEARRSQLQTYRNAQRLRAQATNAAVGGNAQYGSGLQGGLGGITGAANENVLGVNQALGISQNIFGLNNNISADKIQEAKLGGYAATDQAISAFGGSLSKSASTIGGLAKDAGASLSTMNNGGFGLGSIFMGGFSPTGL